MNLRTKTKQALQNHHPILNHMKTSYFERFLQDISAFAPLTAVSKRADLGGVSPDELMAGQMPKVDDGGDGTNLGDDDHAPCKAKVYFFFVFG